MAMGRVGRMRLLVVGDMVIKKAFKVMKRSMF
jgi:hypothetical protein